jgi:hypothetical protein
MATSTPLGDETALRSYRRRHHQNPILSNQFLIGLSEDLIAEMVIPNSDGNFSPPDSTLVERMVAEHSGGTYLHGKKYWDTLATTGQSQAHNTGLEVKLCANITDSTMPVLGKVNTESFLNEGETLESLDPAEVGRRVCALEAQKKADTSDKLRSEGQVAPRFSELMIIWGDRKKKTFTVWTEPYEVDEVLAQRLVWRKLGKRYAAFTPEVIAAASTDRDLKGQQILEWYPKGGQLKYCVSAPPQGVETATIAWPSRTLDADQIEQFNAFKKGLARQIQAETNPDVGSMPASDKDDIRDQLDKVDPSGDITSSARDRIITEVDEHLLSTSLSGVDSDINAALDN